MYGYEAAKKSTLLGVQHYHKICEGSRTVRNYRENLRVQKERLLASPAAQGMTQGFKLALGKHGKGQDWCACALENSYLQLPETESGAITDSNLYIDFNNLYNTPNQQWNQVSTVPSSVGYPLLCHSTCPNTLHPQNQLEVEPEPKWYFIISALFSILRMP